MDPVPWTELLNEVSGSNSGARSQQPVPVGAEKKRPIHG